MRIEHIPVLLNEAIEGLSIKSGDIVVDATLGGAGHSSEICRKFGKDIKLIGIDMDQDAITQAQEKLKACDAIQVEGNMRNIDLILNKLGIVKVDRILADLGLNSSQLDTSGRGFTFQKDEPLNMSLKKETGLDDLTARDVVNDWQEENLADIIYGFGEERYSRRIASKIVEMRKTKPLETTFDLVEAVSQAVPSAYKRGRTHFATKTFQAIRMAVNDELRALEDFSNKSFEHLSSGGRLAIITFHSLEDRQVKRFFKEKHQLGLGKVITKKPITPSDEEISINRRSRSAKLRILEKI